MVATLNGNGYWTIDGTDSSGRYMVSFHHFDAGVYTVVAGDYASQVLASPMAWVDMPVHEFPWKGILPYSLRF